jgi:flagellar hook-basal body complex protein FliE
MTLPEISRRQLLSIFAVGTAAAQLMPKAQVANLIAKVENGVDEFSDYLKRRGENARSAQSSASAQSRRARRGPATESQKTRSAI